MRATQFPMKSFTGNYRPGEIVGNFRPESARSWILYPMRMIRARYQLLFFSKSSCRVSDDLNPYFSERSPELEGDKIIIQAPGRAERSLLRARDAAGAKLRCLRLLRAIRCAISPANRSMGNDRFPANVQKTTFSCDRQHPLCRTQ